MAIEKALVLITEVWTSRNEAQLPVIVSKRGWCGASGELWEERKKTLFFNFPQDTPRSLVHPGIQSSLPKNTQIVTGYKSVKKKVPKTMFLKLFLKRQCGCVRSILLKTKPHQVMVDLYMKC